MADESDGIEDAVDTTVRLAAMAGARLGSEIARAREEGLREQRRIDERDAERLAQRFEAEKRAAVAELSQVYRADWWERADAARIGQTYATARAWTFVSDEAAAAEAKMRAELGARYQIDGLAYAHVGSVSAQVEAWQQRLEQQRREEADRQRTAETVERAEAAVLLDQAARDDRQADAAREDARRADAETPLSDQSENPRLATGQDPQDSKEAEHRSRESDARGDQAMAEAEMRYDSAERRAADARALEARGINPDVAQSRMHADAGAAKPATLATAGVSRGRAPKGRPAVGRGAQVERAGVER